MIEPISRRSLFAAGTAGASFASFVLALGVVITACTFYGWSTVGFGDGADYVAAANQLCEEGSFPRQSSLPFFRAPLYPALIAAASGGCNPDHFIVAIKICGCLLFALTALVVWVTAHLLSGSRRAATLSSLAFTLNPLTIMQSVDVQSEPLHTFLVCLGVLLIIVWMRGLEAAAIFGGLSWGLAALTRPTALVPALALGFLGFRLHRRPSWSALALYVLGLATPLTIWGATNLAAVGVFIPTTDALGYHLWLGHQAGALDLYGPAGFDSGENFQRVAYQQLQVQAPRLRIQEWESTVGYSQRNLKEREALWRNEALNWISRHPAQTLELWFWKGFTYFRPYLLPGAYPPAVVLGSLLFGMTWFGLVAIGWKRLRTMDRQIAHLFLALVLTSALPHVLTHSMVRFRVPYVDAPMASLIGLLWGRREGLIPSRRSE